MFLKDTSSVHVLSTKGNPGLKLLYGGLILLIVLVVYIIGCVIFNCCRKKKKSEHKKLTKSSKRNKNKKRKTPKTSLSEKKKKEESNMYIPYIPSSEVMRIEMRNKKLALESKSVFEWKPPGQYRKKH